MKGKLEKISSYIFILLPIHIPRAYWSYLTESWDREEYCPFYNNATSLKEYIIYSMKKDMSGIELKTWNLLPKLQYTIMDSIFSKHSDE